PIYFDRHWAFCPTEPSKCPDPVSISGHIDIFCNHNGIPTLCCSKSINLITTVSENNREATLKLSPNPASNYLYIDYNQLSESPDYYTILDITGKIILKKDLNNNNEKIERLNTSLFLSGIYLVNFYNDKNVTIKSQKLIISKD
ncbi:MAG: T9SS type A sorting domain-containing protein, partial [Candidatus Kapabacteria bacterium]|nr:T9SS type A sorting domain-containing protein [Candidatus Kapabacteria bacterium]